MNREWIAYVGPFRFPWGQAGSRRVYGNARTLTSLGYDVRVGCGENESPLREIKREEMNGATLSWCGLSELPPKNSTIFRKAWTQIFSWGSNTVRWLSTQNPRPAFVILYGGLSAFAWRVQKWCRENGVPFIVDVVEWYDPKQLSGGRYGPLYLSSQFALKQIYPKADGLIVISSFLERCFSGKKLPTVIIPPTTDDISPPVTPLSADDHLRLVYAGTPGHKDLLSAVIPAVISTNDAGHKVELLIIGPTPKEVVVLSKNVRLPRFITAIGSIEQTKVKEYVSVSDFSILIRPSERFTNAGFPTKFVESIAAGTPVIGNCTSDICRYLIDGENGIVARGISSSEIAEAITRAALLPLSRRKEMKAKAFSTAREAFHFSAHTAEMKNFLDCIRNRGRRP